MLTCRPLSCARCACVQVYIDFLNRVNELVSKKYRKKMQYWGDIVLQYVAKRF